MTIKRLARKALRCPLRLMGKVERRYTANFHGPAEAPIFIVGPARSGTTLIYQAVVQSLSLSYLSNAAASLPWCPALLTKLLASFDGCTPPADFNSHYGRAPGWSAPSQGSATWSRWFRDQAGQTEPVAWTPKSRAEMVGMVAAIEQIHQMPFINKWPGHNVHMLSLHKAFPHALYLRVRRDPLQTAQSVLRGRRELANDPHHSISRVPRLYTQYTEAGYIEQVCAYVLGIEMQLDEDSAVIGLDRFFTVDYEDFCAAPRERIEDFRQWYAAATGFQLKNRMEIPESFKCSTSRKVSECEYEAIRRCLDAMSSRHGIAAAS